ncbi:MAG: hypothetical protein LBF74_09525 [Treponema sp.]|nr:hypothetical protein [Treponema sp.]
MWSFTGDKSHQYWLWRAIDHNSGEPLAFHLKRLRVHPGDMVEGLLLGRSP